MRYCNCRMKRAPQKTIFGGSDRIAYGVLGIRECGRGCHSKSQCRHQEKYKPHSGYGTNWPKTMDLQEFLHDLFCGSEHHIFGPWTLGQVRIERHIRGWLARTKARRGYELSDLRIQKVSNRF